MQKKEVGWCGNAELIDTCEARKSSSACNRAEWWFSFSIFIGNAVVGHLHPMTAGFGMCLPIDPASRLLIACSPCFGPETCAKSFWRQRLPAAGGSLCLLHCLEQSSFGCYFEIQNHKHRGRWEIYFFFPTSFCPDICLHPGFPTFLGLRVPAILLFFCFLFHLEIFFLKHFLPSTSFNKTNCCGMIYASTSKFLLLYSIIPMLFHKKTKSRKKAPKK